MPPGSATRSPRNCAQAVRAAASRVAASNLPRRRRCIHAAARSAAKTGSSCLQACADGRRRSASSICGTLDAHESPNAMPPWAPTRCCTSRRRSKPTCPAASCASIRSPAARNRPARTPLRLAVAQAPAIGLLPRHPQRAYRTSPAAASICRRRLPRRISRLLWSELLRTNREREVAFRGEARYVAAARPRPAVASSRRSIRDVPLRLESRERGHLDTLALRALRPAAMRPGRSADRRQSRRHELPRRAQGARALSRRSARRAHLRRRSRRHRQGRRRGRDARGAGRSRLRSRRLWPRHADARARRRRAAHSRAACPSRKRPRCRSSS